MKKNEKQTLSNWLEILQQESWHLELLISGFAIFLLVGARDPLNLFIYNSSVTSTGIIAIDLALTVPSIILIGSWFVLLINLIVHVMFRGLWVSTIGLRYVSGDIDFNSLELTPKFKSFLEHRIVNFDTFINRLEKLCSSIFGFTFLIIFVIISTGLFFFLASGLILLSAWSPSPMDVFFEGVVFIYFVGGGIYLIDFISLGWLKKLPKIGRFYFPLYLFYSLITLSFIYRPLYYNLIDNKFGRKVVLFLIPYGLLFLFTIAYLLKRINTFHPMRSIKPLRPIFMTTLGIKTHFCNKHLYLHYKSTKTIWKFSFPTFPLQMIPSSKIYVPI